MLKVVRPKDCYKREEWINLIQMFILFKLMLTHTCLCESEHVWHTKKGRGEKEPIVVVV